MLRESLDHVKWFVDPAAFPTRYDLLLTPAVLVALALALVAVGIAAFIQSRYPEPRPVKILERFAPIAPTVLGLHLGVALFVAAVVGLLFVPSLQIPSDNAFGFAILTIEAMCGLMILFGVATRAGAVLLGILGIVAMVPFTFESILEQIHILGIAAFLFLVGRGPISLDRLRGVAPPIEHREIPRAALTLLRVAMGFGIFYGALTEKLLNPGLSEALLQARPWLNVARPFGISDGQFVFLAGLTELVIGAVILSGRLTRPVVVIGAIIFTVSVPFFGWSELLGHLPYYGIMFTLLLAPNADSWRVRQALRPSS